MREASIRSVLTIIKYKKKYIIVMVVKKLKLVFTIEDINCVAKDWIFPIKLVTILI